MHNILNIFRRSSNVEANLSDEQAAEGEGISQESEQTILIEIIPSTSPTHTPTIDHPDNSADSAIPMSSIPSSSSSSVSPAATSHLPHILVPPLMSPSDSMSSCAVPSKTPYFSSSDSSSNISQFLPITSTPSIPSTSCAPPPKTGVSRKKNKHPAENLAEVISKAYESQAEAQAQARAQSQAQAQAQGQAQAQIQALIQNLEQPESAFGRTIAEILSNVTNYKRRSELKAKLLQMVAAELEP